MTLLFVLAVFAAGSSSDELVGLWTTERPTEGRESIESVEVDFRAAVPLVYVAGETLEVRTQTESRWRAALPDGSAEILLIKEHGTLRGYWIQPPRPSAQGQSTPIRFSLASASRWRGTVRPFLPATALTIQIRRDRDGKLVTLARETEWNGGLFLGLTTLELEGDEVVFQTRRNGPLKARRLGEDRMAFPVGGSAVVLSKVKTHREFQPRYRPSRAREPMPDADWPTAPLSEMGFAPEPIHALIKELGDAEPKSLFDPMVHSLFVARRGRLVVEEYFFGHGPDRVHDTRSAGKSLASILLGALAHRNQLNLETLVNQPFCDLTTDYSNACDDDERKRRITLGHLLSMSSGFACNDDDSESPGNEEQLQSQQRQPDWYRYTIELPMAREPGEKGVYCSSGINLTGAAMKAIGGRNVTELFDRLIAQPLGINHYHHNLAPSGDGYFGGGFRFRGRDLLKLGEVMRTGGLWHSRRILPEPWAALAFKARSSLNTENDYGYGWWRRSYDVNGRIIETAHASGNGGQLLFVVPELETVILVHGGNYGNYGTWRRFLEEYVPRILRAVVAAPRG